MADRRAIVIGAGIGGLSAAIELACVGWPVTVFERADAVGGKMREAWVGAGAIDVGPTVLTMPWVFERLFAAAGRSLADFVTLESLDVLARHAWPDGAALDLFRDRARSADAIAALAGIREKRGYLAFCADAQRIYNTLRNTFLDAPKPNPLTLTARVGPWRVGELQAIRPFGTLWGALGGYFRDPRLRQLFARYATYTGSSPFAAPATLMLIAHVEQDGVFTVKGGMQRLAAGMRALAESLGVRFRLGEGVECIVERRGRAAGIVSTHGAHEAADAIVCNADPAALAAGLFGEAAQRAISPPRAKDRSLSALTWAIEAKTSGFPLSRHNVFFSSDYAREFAHLRSGLPSDPTIYVCAQDHGAEAHKPERLFALVNAPARGDSAMLDRREIDACEERMLAKLRVSGLQLEVSAMQRTSSRDFETLFPATGGALYGQATHGWAGSFLRPGARTKIPGLYLTGGGVHPGAGVPMTALSGRLAAQAILKDHASTAPSRRAATPGGMSTGKARIAAMD